MKRDEQTYGKIRRKYEQWIENESNRPERDRLRRVDPYEPAPTGTSDMSRFVFAAIGIGIGAILLALSAYAFYTAGQWGDYARDGAQTGYTVVGVFLLIAGIGGIAATWNHNFRVLTRRPEHH